MVLINKPLENLVKEGENEFFPFSSHKIFYDFQKQIPNLELQKNHFLLVLWINKSIISS